MSEIRRNNADGNNRLRVRYSRLACSNGLGRAAITPQPCQSVTDPVICVTPSCMFIEQGAEVNFQPVIGKQCSLMRPEHQGAASLKQA